MSLIKVLVKDICVSVATEADEVLELAAKKLNKCLVSLRPVSLSVFKRSVDARKKDSIKLVYTVCAECEVSSAPDEEILSRCGISILKEAQLEIECGTQHMGARPIVVGFGPAGMFCALVLAERGYRPIVIERGDDVDIRLEKKERFYTTHSLDVESNIQFGAGGAGTFSDGKLVTRINDPACSYVLRAMHELGAPEDVLTRAKPHVGTDKLLTVVKNADSRIRELGGEIYYRTRLDGIDFDSTGKVVSITVNGTQSIPCGVLCLCIGHSARDTYAMLMRRGIDLVPKPFSVGVRIEHLRADIDRAMYGDESLSELLGPAEYNLSYNTKNRGVYTFCMCPGGEVVAATSEEGGVVVNGMSNYKRDGLNSNCAVAVSVFESDYGGSVARAISFQRSLERIAFSAGGGDYAAPVTTLGDFFDRRGGSVPRRVQPTYMGGDNIKLCNFSDFCPDFIYSSLRDGIAAFDKKIKGFACSDAILSAFETRTSAPARILRTEARYIHGHENFYPCGEGAGYAGGITSAAVDGLRTAIEIIGRYSPSDF